jgi:outer membrane protein assembly factor BamD
MKFKILAALFVPIFLFSCKSALEKMLANGTPEEKEAAAKEFYENKKYFKASPLYKSLLSDYAGSVKVEEMFYYYAMCDYHLKDYYTAAYELKRLVQRFPRSQYAEEASYFAAMSYYHASPIYQLDQEATYRAIEEFQLFLDRYPSSIYQDKVNERVDELNEKLEKKAFEQAFLYFKTEDYNSAIVDLQTVLDEFPDTERRYKIKLLQIESTYKYALQSVENKKIERLEECIERADKFIQQYTGVEAAKTYVKRAEQWSLKSEEAIKSLRYSIPEYYLRKKKFDDAIEQWRNLRKIVPNEEKEAVNLKIVDALFKKAVEAKGGEKIEYFQNYLRTYERLKTVAMIEQEKRQLAFAKKEIKTLPAEIPSDLFAQADYKSARKFAKLYNDTATEPNKDIWNIWYKASYEYAKQLDVSEAKLIYDTLRINAVNNKDSKWIQKADEKLELYPVLLVKKPYRDKEYKKAIFRGKEIIKDKNIVGKEKEEIVYLLIASAYKHAKKGKKFERPARYENVIKLVAQYRNQISDKKLLMEIDKMEEKAKEKLEAFKEKLD